MTHQNNATIVYAITIVALIAFLWLDTQRNADKGHTERTPIETCSHAADVTVCLALLLDDQETP